jgi:hypothetical protein
LMKLRVSLTRLSVIAIFASGCSICNQIVGKRGMAFGKWSKGGC